jgi:pimeloyl-ACP methyl ester carboxylesterase
MATTPYPIATTHALVRPHGTLAYDVQGDGPLVVLVPGLGELRQAYRLLAPRLVAAGLRVATVDLRGHGESSTGWDAYDGTAMGGDLVALIETLGGPALVVGNSYGAGPAVWAASERPDLVRGLILTGPFVRDHPTPWYLKLAMSLMFRGPWRVRAWDAFYGGLFKAGTPSDHAEHRARLRANLSEPGRFAALSAMLKRSDAAIEARLERVKVPTLVLMGSRDPDFPDPAREANELAAALHGEAELLAGVGHYPHLEIPDAMATRVLAFAAEHDGGAAARG